MSILTNAHTHLELGWLSDSCPGVSGQPFVSWLSHLVERRWHLGSDWQRIYEAAIEDGILELLASGATHVGDITATGLSIGPLLASGLKGIVYVEVLGLSPEQADERLNHARSIIDAWRPKERSDMRVGLSIHAPYSVHPALWEKALEYARKESLPLCIHVAESPAEYDYLILDTGPMVDEYYLSLNLTPVRAPMVTPVQYLEDLGALALRPLLVHTIHVIQEDILRIAANDCSVVHCPRSNLRLQCGRMPLEAFLAADIPVYLGTDSRASSPSLDIRDELEVAVALHHGRVNPEAIEAMLQRPLPDVSDESP